LAATYREGMFQQRLADGDISIEYNQLREALQPRPREPHPV
jgi:hypothetical protein